MLGAVVEVQLEVAWGNRLHVVAEPYNYCMREPVDVQVIEACIHHVPFAGCLVACPDGVAEVGDVVVQALQVSRRDRSHQRCHHCQLVRVHLSMPTRY